jgi:putative ABC transport system permease protein
MKFNLASFVPSLVTSSIPGKTSWTAELLAVAMTQFAGITTTVSIPAVFLAFGVSGAIGIVFGYYPAWRAAKLNPIDALRYE